MLREQMKVPQIRKQDIYQITRPEPLTLSRSGLYTHTHTHTLYRFCFLGYSTKPSPSHLAVKNHLVRYIWRV